MRIPSEIESSESDEITQISFAMLCILFVCFLSAHFTLAATPHTGCCLCCMAKINCIARLARAQSFTWKFSSVVGGAVNSPLRSRLITLCCIITFYIFSDELIAFFHFFLSSAQFSSPRVFHLISVCCARAEFLTVLGYSSSTQHLSRARDCSQRKFIKLGENLFSHSEFGPRPCSHIICVLFFACFNLHLVHLCSRLIFHFFSPGEKKLYGCRCCCDLFGSLCVCLERI